MRLLILRLSLRIELPVGTIKLKRGYLQKEKARKIKKENKTNTQHHATKPEKVVYVRFNRTARP